MKQKLLSILALLLMAVTSAWADTTVTWTENDMSELFIDFESGTAMNNTIKGITATASDGGWGEWYGDDINNDSEGSTTITFTSSVGNIKSIAIKAEDIYVYSNPPGGWTLSGDNQKLSWSGDASSTVSLLLSAGEDFNGISEIVFTIESAAAIFAIDTDGTTQDFGSVEVGATAQKTFTITNSGNKSLYVNISNPEGFTAEMTQNANVYFADALGWGDIHVYYWPNGLDWPGAAMTELYTNELGQKVYCYELPADVEGVIFNGNGNQTGDIYEPIGKAYYIKDDNTVGTWSYDNCVPADMSRVLTVTMNTATLGSKSGNITLSFDAKNATSFTIPCTGEVAAPTTYIVAGNYSEIFGLPWYGTYEANKMTKGDDGKYTKTYNVEDAFSDIQLKVVKDGVDWIGDETGDNVTFSMKQAGSFTVTLDPNANPVYVTVTGDNVVFPDTEYAINYAAGMQNGTVTGPDTAKEDDEVTLTITPAAGYVLESISVTGVTTENAVEVTDGKFTMPAEDVNVIATFKLVTYAITLAEGTEDADNWTVSPNPAEAGQTVTISYTGTKKVKSIKAVKKAAAAATDLSTLTADYEAKDGETLTGTLANNVKISIADGATVTLKDVTITNLGNNCDWAGINCPGNATLVLEGTNTVGAGRDGDGYNNYPGIYIAPDKTLTIQGDGTLTAYSDAYKPYGAGIGGGYNLPCGNIVINSGNITATGGNKGAGIGGRSGSCGNITINGGTITATGGEDAAGIGGGGFNTCGTITISGGTVEATGGDYAAGIGGGSNNGSCGTITITSGVTQVTATKGSGAPYSIGNGYNGFGISVTIEDGANVIQN